MDDMRWSWVTVAAVLGCGGGDPGGDASDLCDPASCAQQCRAADRDDGYCTDGYCVCLDVDGGGEADDAATPQDDGAADDTNTDDVGNEDEGDETDTMPATCTVDDDCDDGRYCSGTERCVAGACQPGIAPACYDDTRCTEDSCNPATDACAHRPVDRDGDGYPADHVLGEDCGGLDCDDTDPTVHVSAPELCDDGKDNDCDTLTDAADPDCG